MKNIFSSSEFSQIKRTVGLFSFVSLSYLKIPHKLKKLLLWAVLMCYNFMRVRSCILRILYFCFHFGGVVTNTLTYQINLLYMTKSKYAIHFYIFYTLYFQSRYNCLILSKPLLYKGYLNEYIVNVSL